MVRTFALSLGTALLTSAASAQSRWDGADELPVNPVAGDGGAGEVAAQPCDGGKPTNADAR